MQVLVYLIKSEPCLLVYSMQCFWYFSIRSPYIVSCNSCYFQILVYIVQLSKAGLNWFNDGINFADKLPLNRRPGKTWRELSLPFSRSSSCRHVVVGKSKSPCYYMDYGRNSQLVWLCHTIIYISLALSLQACIFNNLIYYLMVVIGKTILWLYFNYIVGETKQLLVKSLQIILLGARLSMILNNTDYPNPATSL